jgi:UDP-2,4-diacetamido-2,4,6-trideoxy-beta-L-altropyranose hydrolase
LPLPAALFRFDASPIIGAGHAMRSLALANHLARAGWRTTMATDAGTLDALPRRARSFHRRTVVDAADPPAALAAHGPYDLLVVDHYGRDAAWERACRSFCRRILVIDDLADRPHDADWLLDPADPAREHVYRPLVPASCRLLLGPAYAPLRPQFASARAHAPDRSRPLRRILVAPGATDPTDLARASLAAIERAGLAVDVDVMLGGRAPHLDALREQARAMRLPVALHIDTEDVAALMARADLAIGAPGSSAWERCAVGLPSVIMIAAENQRSTATVLTAAGAAVMADGPDDLARRLTALAQAPEELAAMAARAARLCDGRGLDRLLLALLDPARARDRTDVTLRLVEPDDADLLLEWQRHPETRRHSPDPTPPEPAAHRRWLAARHGDPACLMTIAMHGGRPVGALRLDREAPRPAAATVSIYAAPSCYRQGYGRAMLELASRTLPGMDLVARILPANQASLALFRAAGYHPAGSDLHVLDRATERPAPAIR